MEINYANNILNTKPYAFAEVDKAVEKLRNKGVEVVDFGVGDPSSPTANFVINNLSLAAQKRAESGYPSYVGDRRFLEAASNYLQNNFGVKLDSNTQITSTIGSKEAVFHFPLGFVNSGDYVICPTPGYPPYQNGTRFAGGIPYFVPLLEENNFLIDYKNIPQDVCDKSKLIWINYPNSPTGATASKEWYKGFVEWASSNNIIIAADEGCYIDIYFEEKPVSILEVATEGIITFYSLSKRNNMTGYRVGFCAGDSRIIDGFKKVKTNVDSGTPTFIQDVAALALADNAHAEEMRKEYQHKIKVLSKTLADIGLPPSKSEATFYLWQKVPQKMSSVCFAKILLDVGVVVTPGDWISDTCHDGVNPGAGYVRFAVVAPIEMFNLGIERIKTLNFNTHTIIDTTINNVNLKSA